MSNKILVAYASRAGSTAGVAEAIGDVLREDGAQVDVCPMQEVTDLSPYRAVVAGSAIRGGQWLPEAMTFLRTHRTVLSQKAFVAFLVCMTLSMKNKEHHAGVVKWLDPVREQVKPISEGYFAGALDFSNLPLHPNILMMRLATILGV